MGDTLRVFGIYGSPRRGGNTDLLLTEALRGAEAEGAEVERLRAGDLAIRPCRACQACFKDGACILADGMQEIYPRLLAADVVILASPIYFYGITAQAKALVDRCQALWARRYILHRPVPRREGWRRRGFFIAVGGGRGRRAFEGAILTARYFFDAFDARYAGELLFPGVDAIGDILKDPAALPRAFAAGQRIVSEPDPQPGAERCFSS
jgi:multimeric flavodoxin WrbA